MPKGIPIDKELRARATRAAIEAAREGIPAHVVASWHGVSSRVLYTWLRDDPEAYAARMEAINNDKRFKHAGSDRPEHKAAIRKMALRRLAMYRQEHQIELRKPSPRKVRIPPAPRPVVEHRTF